MRTGFSRGYLFLGILFIGVFLFLAIYLSRKDRSPDGSNEISASVRKAGKDDRVGDLSSEGGRSGSSRKPGVDTAESKPMKTRSSDRSAPPDRSKLPTVDLLAAADETPPWPEGPRVMAEVATESKRFVNLRPNNVGIMPTINIGTEESAAIRLDFPDASPGDRIHVELADGGYFSGTEKSGQVFSLGETRKLEFTVNSDDRTGHLKLLLRQSGHTRVIPFWVGPPLPLAQSAHN